MGRGRPLLPLNFDVQPYGFIGKYQSQFRRGRTAPAVADAIAAWLVKTPTLGTPMAESLSRAFRDSPSWDFTRQLIPMLEQVPSFTEDQLALLEEAAEVNVDVCECDIGGTPGPTWVANFVGARRGPVAPAPWEDVPF